MKSLLLAALLIQAQPGQDRLLVVTGRDTVAYAVTDTIEVVVGEVTEIVPEIHSVDGLRPPSTLWVHNTSPEFLSFQSHIGRDRYSADPIRVTATQPVLAPAMIHWSMEGGGAVWLRLRAVEREYDWKP